MPTGDPKSDARGTLRDRISALEGSSAPPIQTPNHTGLYIASVCALAFVTMAAIVLVSVLLPGRDNALIIGQILTVAAPTTVALLAYIKGSQNNEAIREVHLSVNSRMDKLLEQKGIASRAAGREEGRAETASAAPTFAAADTVVVLNHKDG